MSIDTDPKKKDKSFEEESESAKKTTDPQENMEGPISSMMQGIKDGAEDNNKESKEESDKEKDKNK